ncbi:MAG: DnaJ C-terminal domain-containing protein [Hyphomicrobium sp.]
MADDPYSVLGVPRNASDDDIRRAYLKLVKELHPDVNPSKAAHERFKKVTNANDILGDADKRRAFDRGEIDGAGEPRRTWSRPPPGAGSGARSRGGPAGPGGPDFGFGDVFEDLLSGLRGGAARGAGATHPAKGRDVRYTLEVEFDEAVLGARKRVTMPEGGVLDLAVPEGVSDGQVLRLRGKGSPGPGGQDAGDALVEIKVRSHPLLKRQGDDILLELPITIDEAVLGARVEATTVAGRVQLTVPKGTSSGTVLRLKGKGVRNPATLAQGDQLVTIRIVLPETIDQGLAYFMSEWRKDHSYDPGRKG